MTFLAKLHFYTLSLNTLFTKRKSLFDVARTAFLQHENTCFTEKHGKRYPTHPTQSVNILMYSML